MRGLVLAKREPATAPRVTTAALPSHHGSLTDSRPVPCRTADAASAPKISPPGNRSRCKRNATAVIDEQHREFAERCRIACSAASDRPSSLRARARRQSDHDQQHAHHLHHRDAADVGVELRRQRHHLRHRSGARPEQCRERLPAVHEPQVASGGQEHDQRRHHRIATLPGQLAMPLTISGVTTAPSITPTSTKEARAIGSVTVIGRPMSAAQATASIDPVTRPAGKPVAAMATPPSVAISRVSAVRRMSRWTEEVSCIDRSRMSGSPRDAQAMPRTPRAADLDQCRAAGTTSNEVQAIRIAGIRYERVGGALPRY